MRKMKMIKIPVLEAHIECNRNGWVSIYVETELPFGVLGEGATIEDAKKDFLEALNEMIADHRNRVGELVEIEKIDFVLDTTAFLRQYKGIFSLAGLAKITGVNKAQLSQYVCGTRNPTEKTQKKIREAVHSFIEELSLSY